MTLMFPRGGMLALVLLAAAGPSGCQSAETPTKSEGAKPMKLDVNTAAFAHQGTIPKKYTGEGQDVSPPISWSGLPQGTQEIAVICDDPDAPTPDPWVHWVIYKIPANAPGLPEGIPRNDRLTVPPGAVQGKNSWPSNNVGYRGPMPPPGHGTHHYHFRVYALDTKLAVEPGLDKKSLLGKMEGHILGEGVVTGTYAR